MQNTGTWNSDLAIIFLMCLISPIVFYFIGAMFQNMSSEQLQDEPKRANPTPPRQTPTSVNISVSIPNLFKGSSSTGKSKNKTKRPTKPKKKKRSPDNPKPLTDEAVVSDAVSGLCNMGYKKGEATKIVKSISDKKEYNSAESLLKDCFMCIS